jgi:hypothetical protein
MLRWLLLIPFALLFAILAGMVALLVASVASPDIALLIGGGFERLLAALFAQAESGVDPGAGGGGRLRPARPARVGDHGGAGGARGGGRASCSGCAAGCSRAG